MPCQPIFGTSHFLGDLMVHVDCQAETLGSSGFGALADPGSAAFLTLSALLTIFVALFGFRLLMGGPVEGRDLVGSLLKVGIVLTLATSWPAWRVLGYDLVIHGPAEVAQSIGLGSGLPGSNGDLTERLDNADQAIVGLTVFGSGRLTGGQPAGTDLGNSFEGAALSDESALGFGRLAFLAGTLAPLTIVRICSGLLLALAPLMAGLLLFGQTEGLFFGWLRGLAACALGSLALTIVYEVELAVLEPWLSNVLVHRQGHILAPSAPTELLVITLTFAIAALGVLALFTRVAFFGRSIRLPAVVVRSQLREAVASRSTQRSSHSESIETPARAFILSQAVAQAVRREGRAESRIVLSGAPGHEGPMVAGGIARGRVHFEPLGSSHRRTYRRTSSSADRRDRQA
jgi:type IV secretion system protein VirB6